jgi:hypothetical protein
MLLLSWVGSAAKSAPTAVLPSAPSAATPSVTAPAAKPNEKLPAAALEGKAPETLSAS